MKHPFAEEVIEKKRAYVIGVAIVVLENGEVTKKQEKYLEKLVANLELEHEELETILKVAKGYQAVKTTVLNLLDTPYKKNCFLMELYSLFYQTSDDNPKLVKGILEFAKLLEISTPESDLVKEVYKQLVYKNKIYLSQIGKRCKKEQVFLGKDMLKYFSEDEDFILQEERVLTNGEELIITKPYKISGVLKVLKGARLIFKGSKVELHAPIQVEGGFLEIENTQFKAHSDMGNYMFIITDSEVHIRTSHFDGNGTTGIWCQVNGALDIEKSYFTHTANRSCISLWECQTHIEGSHFIGCEAQENNGGAIFTNSNLEVVTTFFEGCKAYKGAAIYRQVTTIPWVTDKQPEKSYTRKHKKEENKMLSLFGKKVDFIPIPKKISSIAYQLILKQNQFWRCDAVKQGIICAYKTQVIIDEKNSFEECEGKNFYIYET